jgi:predicted NBD/HSP70 family sugar kinase
VSICDADGTLRASSRPDNVPLGNLIDAARVYAAALRDLIEASEIDVNRIVGIGVALSGRTQPDRAQIVTSDYFGWANDGGEFCREIQKIIDLPVEIENISNALAIAEMRFGGARDVANFTLIHAATFVGAGVVSDNRLVRGESGISGLLGHFRAEQRSLTCVCGRHDCLNLSATGFGLLSQLGKLDHRAFDTSKLSFYATSLLDVLDDPEAANFVAEAGEKLAPALDSAVKLLGPKMTILSGYLGANECYFNAVKDTLERHFDYNHQASFQLVKGRISSVESAALLALHAFCYSDRLDYDRFAQTCEGALGVTHG